jgi:glycosyltransferase involved in cell wall biosynthesis
VALVGAYHMQSHSEIFNLFKKNIDKFNLITHSSVTPDYKWCIDNDLPVRVIPNGVDLAEFDNTIDFREKYNIKEKYIILNIGNFFEGKGFEIIPQVCRKLSKKLDDFIILQLSNTIKYPYDKVFLDRTRKQSSGLNIRFMRDLPREDVVAAFLNSDVFLMPSRKEVAPLVILESRAAKLPWVSMRVGDISNQAGGIPIEFENVDQKEYVFVDSKIINHFVAAIVHLLKMPRLRQGAIREGQTDIEEIDWDNIVPLYHEVFSR